MNGKRLYVGECVSRSTAEEGIDSVKDCFQKRGLNVEQTRRTVYGRNEC